jgi:hypothetical protein
MNVRRICFLGTRTANFDATAIFFRDVLGLQLGIAEPGWSGFRLPSEPFDFVENFGPEKTRTSSPRRSAPGFSSPSPLTTLWRREKR